MKTAELDSIATRLLGEVSNIFVEQVIGLRDNVNEASKAIVLVYLLEVIERSKPEIMLSGQLKGMMDAAEIVYAIWTQSPVGTSADLLQHKIRCAILSAHDKLKGTV